MSKIIKKQIKRSMPWFVILSMITTMIAGAFFNFEIKFDSIGNWHNFGIELPEVSANSDIIDTEVTVRNAAPTFSGVPYESPSSTTTSPANAGFSFSFKGTGDDPEGNSYYLIVCSSDSVVVNPIGGVPSCGDTMYCVSGLTTDTNEATCIYNSVDSALPESVDWYAFVCDNHASDADCSDASQGLSPNVGDDSSPFYVNHAPTIDSVLTSDDNKDPGGTFTITATAADADIARGDDYLRLTICDTNSWATSTGCAGTTICTSTPTTDDPSCSFTDEAPTPDDDYTYYAFIADFEYTNTTLQLPATGNPASSTYTINNVAPSVGSITLNDGAPIVLNLKNTSNKVVYATTTVTDNNGCADLVNATSTLYYSNVAGGDSCSLDDNNCYESLSCVIYGCSGGSAVADVTCSSTMEFHAIPTDPGYANNPYRDYDWDTAIRAFDEALSGLGITATGVELNSVAGIDIDEAAIAYGILRAGDDSGDVNATTTVINFGNTPLNADVLVSDMSSGTAPIKIGADNQEWSLANFTYGVGTDSSSTTPQNVNTVIPRPTNLTDVEDEIYWGINIPGITPSGDYTGTSSFTAAVDDNVGEW